MDRREFGAVLSASRERPSDTRLQRPAVNALYGLARLVANDKAIQADGDLLQDAVVHAWGKWVGKARCDRDVWSWAYATLHRKMLDGLKYRHVRRRVVTGDAAWVESVSVSAEQTEDTLIAVLDELSGRGRL